MIFIGRGVLFKSGSMINPIPHGVNPHVVSMSDICAYLAWPDFFSRIPRNFLMVSKTAAYKSLVKMLQSFQLLSIPLFQKS